MGYSVAFTASFELEYRAILVYLVDVAEAPAAAGKLLAEIDNVISLLSIMPELKAISTNPALAERELREYLVLNYIVLYRVKEETVFLEHIFHAKQNYEGYV